MLHHPLRCRRPGAVTVEAAVVYPVLLMLIVGVIVIGLGVSRYQQVTALARDASRWASVRGAQYAKETKNAAATAGDVRDYVVSRAVGMDTSNTALVVDVTWNTDNGITHTDATGNVTRNTVTVTVTYNWMPEMYLTGPISLKSTSVMPMSF